MARYEFGTRWVLDASLESVWEAIGDPREWPEWWRGAQSAELIEAGAEDGTGQRTRYAFRSALPYTLTFETVVREVDPGHLLVADVSGDLEGQGRWEAAEDGGVTVLDLSWHVRTTEPAMNALAPLLRPAFVWNHHRLMRQGAAGLAGRIDARVVRVDSVPVPRLSDWLPLAGLVGAVSLAAVAVRGGCQPAR